MVIYMSKTAHTHTNWISYARDPKSKFSDICNVKCQ